MKPGDEFMMTWEVQALAEGDRVPPLKGILLSVAEFEAGRGKARVAAAFYPPGEVRLVDANRIVITESGPDSVNRRNAILYALGKHGLDEHRRSTQLKRVRRPTTRCSVCGEPQTNAPDGSGITCPNGHGGAEGR